MKFTADTTSKPVVGKEAKALNKALKSNSSLVSPEALKTIQRIVVRQRTA